MPYALQNKYFHLKKRFLLFARIHIQERPDSFNASRVLLSFDLIHPFSAGQFIDQFV